MNSPVWFKRIIEIMVPKPDLIFYLDRPAEDIFKQKPELEIDEIRRQQEAIREMMKGRCEAYVIDASVGVEKTIANVNEKIELWLEAQRG